jgi:hypothetical protein
VRTIARAMAGVVALSCLMLWASNAHAYPEYNDGLGNGCVHCHPDFSGGPQYILHFVHTNKFKITQCNFCHENGGGSLPVKTYFSGPGGGYGCAGCHGRVYGETSPNSGQPKATAYGLRAYHAAHGVTECADCHYEGNPAVGAPNSFPPILGENVAPPYYGASGTALRNPCDSHQEDTSFDADNLGLDNDGDGLRDYPADPDCPTTTTTTTSTTTTTTTLPVGCGPAPAGCITPEKGVFLVSEKKAGKEKLKLAMKKLQSALVQSDFGDPIAGSTSYAVCVYDDVDQLIGEMSVARAGDNCGSPPKPCWKTVSTKGYKYSDKLTKADGILKMIMSGGDAGKGRIVIIGKNKASSGLNFLPTGIAPLLENNTQATVQVLTSDADCFGVTVTQVKKADGAIFKAVGP